MRAGVIGSGIGGLLAAGFLAEKGYKVEIFEKLPFVGGRFTNIEYKGFQLTTGALHMLPHGNRGPLAMALRELGIDVEIVDSTPVATAQYGGEIFEVVTGRFPIASILKFNWEILRHKLFNVERSLADVSEKLDPFSKAFTRAFCGWSLSVLPEDIPFPKMKRIYDSIRKYRGPGIPIGGCKSIIDGLMDYLESNEVIISTKNPVKGIEIRNKVARAIFVKGEKKEFDLIISDIGHPETAELTGDESYINKVSDLQSSGGIKISVSVKEPVLGHTGVMFTLDTKRIAGVNEVTQADPELAPSGRHLVMTHQPLVTKNIKYEIRLGLKDLKKIIGHRNYEIIAIQSYRERWPVNRVMAGHDIGNNTPFENLYVVGDGAKGDGIEVEGIAMGVKKVIDEL
jgi:phytoene dehydrogenase-like protein